MSISTGLLQEGCANALEVGPEWYGYDSPRVEEHADAECSNEPRNVVIVSNDKAMNATAVQSNLQALYDIEGRWASKHWHKAEEGLEVKLADTVTSHTDLIIAGGDGTVSWVLNWLFEHEELEDLRIVIVGAGNKNDKAVTLNGTDYLIEPLTNPLYVLDHGHAVTHYGIDILLPNKQRKRAQYIAGLAANAEIARGMDEPEYRSRQRERGKTGRAFRELPQAIKSIRRALPFRARTVNGNRAGQVQKYADLAVVASELAGGGYIHTHTKAYHSDELAVKLTENRLHKMIGGIATLMWGSSPLHTGDYTLELLDPVPLEIDGQVQDELVGPGTVVFRHNRGIVLWGLQGPETYKPKHATPEEASSTDRPYTAQHAKPEH